jgi:cation transport regulator
MPYHVNQDLPDGVKNHLSSQAQTIYREAFNRAWDKYRHPLSRHKGRTREETARRIAWAAVKEKYKKLDDRWVAKIKKRAIT